MIRTAALQTLLMPLPWRIRRPLLRTLFGYDIHATARIGISLVMPSQGVDMGAASCVGHLTIARGMDRRAMREGARIGHLNWLYGIPSSDSSLSHEPGRGRNSSWTSTPPSHAGTSLTVPIPCI